MKKTSIIILLAVLACSSCKKGLDPEIYGSLSPTNFPKTESDFELYTLEVYKPFTSKWGYSDGGISQNLFYGYEHSNVQYNDASTDLMAVSGAAGLFEEISRANFSILKTQGTNSHIEKTRFITKITQIISDVENATTISAAAKKQFLGEARAARGMLMYYLLTMYGPVPVILDVSKIGTEAENDLTRPTEAVYAAATAEDLRFAADNLIKSPTQYGRFNKGLALAFLMRLYLWEKDYTKAEQVGREIQTLGYGLVNNYMSLFRSATEKNNETIFAITTDASANGNGPLANMNAYSWYNFPIDFKGITQSGGWLGPNAFFSASWQFYDSFDPADARRQMLIPQYTAVNSNGGVPTGTQRNRTNMSGAVIVKYPDDESSSFARGNDIPIVRYADVMLMLAEAINQNSGPTIEAQKLVNDVRARSGLGVLPATDVASKQAFSDAILRERGWELFFEGWRRIDLIRFGKWSTALATVGKTPSSTNGLLPIPQYKIDASGKKLSQTPGYQ
jgi:starch-binding outer membrane protein, SusD/RagB family